MPPIVIAMFTVAALCGGGLLGSLLRDRLPDHHVRDDSKDIVKTTSGMVATLVALVIGLLVSSAKSSFDDANSGVTQAGAKMILLDKTLRRYGPEADAVRAKAKASLETAVGRLWPGAQGKGGGIAAIEKGTGLDEVREMIEALSPPAGDARRADLKAEAVGLCKEMGQSRWLLIEQSQGGLPTPLLIMLVFWLTVLFTSLGLLTPRNPTTVACLFVCALSMAGAILLLLELNSPFDGLIEASPGPLLKALALMAG